MICSLCLEDILDGDDFVEVDGRVRHKTCSDEFEEMVEDLEKIYEDTCPQDI